MIDKGKKILFIHIPKCAGTFISQNLTPEVNWNYKNGQHDTLKKAIKRYPEENFNEYFVFTIVRNPYHRLTSFYHFHQRKNFKLFKWPSFIFGSPSHKDYIRDFSSFVSALDMSYDKLKGWAKNDLLPESEYVKNELGIKVQVYHLENMERWIGELEEKTQTSFSSEKVNEKKKEQDYDLLYGGKEKSFVQSFYKEDFANFYPNLLP